MRNNKVLWALQALLAALFLFAGGMKLILPVAAMQQGGMALPGPFLRFIGVAEVCGALGLVLPWLLRIRPELTPIAAGGLVIIMAGATVVTVVSGPPLTALLPLVTGGLAVTVAVGRRRWSLCAVARDRE